ncbi:MAG: hypothetical protein ACN6P0_12445 [Pseudomonas capeferrum]|uniref:hypothetical protein n=1 Tax=Pseudomonas capeferrum TaxID=1495066 RepID=UPI003D1397B4
MGSYWASWVLCSLLFGAGVIWGAIPKGLDFFKLQDIHDFAETIAAIATVVAVGLAYAGYNAWKTELVVTSDHDLARRASVVLMRYKFGAIRGFELARQLALRMRHEVGKEGTAPDMIDEVRSEMLALEGLSSEIGTLAIECKVVWGDEIWEDFNKAFVLADRSINCIDLFLRWSRKETSASMKDKFSEKALDTMDDLIQWVGEGRTDTENYIQGITDPIFAELKKRLVR